MKDCPKLNCLSCLRSRNEGICLHHEDRDDSSEEEEEEVQCRVAQRMDGDSDGRDEAHEEEHIEGVEVHPDEDSESERQGGESDDILVEEFEVEQLVEELFESREGNACTNTTFINMKDVESDC